MLIGLIIAVAVAVVAVAVAALAVGQRVAWRALERHHVLVVLADTATTFDGILWERRGQLLVLRDVTVYTGQRDQGTAADGDVVIERRMVSWMQVTS